MHGEEAVEFWWRFGGIWGQRVVQNLYSVEEEVKLTEQIVFPPFRLDLGNEQLWRENQLVPLPPKTFAVLRYLVGQAGRLVTKEELLKAMWPGTRVSDGIVKGYIRDLRDLLGDDAQQPRFIETVPRRGHRFIAPLTTQPLRSSEFGVRSQNFKPTPSLQPLAHLLVGRDTELAHLHTLFAKAVRGERQIVFVTGEPGIGKTTLVEEFLFGVRSREKFGVQNSELRTLNNELLSTSDPWIGRGQCVEQHGAGEAYLPVLEALGRIGRSPGGEQLVTTLQQYASTWLVQMPALLTAEALETLQRRVVGATRERMLREMVEAVEVLTAHRPLVLWFEDLHWADASTVDWLAAVAHRRAPARLLVIGTYRPSDLSLSSHPLRAVKQELVAKGQCEELWLPFLSAEDVTHYLTRRYAQHQFPAGLGTAIQRRTDGNPLFIVNMVDYLAAQGEIAEVDGHWRLQTGVEEVGRGVPESLRQLIEKHIERLNEEQQRLLEVASVVGVTFFATAVATGIESPVEQVEEWCDELVKRGQFLQAQEPRVLPDGTLCGSYGFLHALQQTVLYERIPSLRRLRLHRRVGDCEEQIYGARAHEIASELAVHFERGQEYDKAAQYHYQAGLVALRRQANREAITHLTQGLELLKLLPDTPERAHQELQGQITLGVPLIATKGYAAPEVASTYTRAWKLCQQVEDPRQRFLVLGGLCGFSIVRAELQTAYDVGTQLLTTAQRVQDPALLVRAHLTLGISLFHRGEPSPARGLLEQGAALYDPQQHSSSAFLFGQDSEVACRCFAALGLWLLGYSDQAVARLREALTLAHERSHSYSRAFTFVFAAWLHQFLRVGQTVQEWAEAASALSAEHGFALFSTETTVLRGWALTEHGPTEEGIAQIRQGMAAFRRTGARMLLPYFLALLAEAYGKAGHVEEGLNMVVEALGLVQQTGERFWEAELYRLKGELLLQRESQKSKGKTQKVKIPNTQHLTPSTRAGAEECFHKAIEIARQQQAKSLELRAVMSLSRLWQRQGKQREAHSMLVEAYNWFTEGFDTVDLKEAQELLQELSRG